jgi:hypothetical protein
MVQQQVNKNYGKLLYIYDLEKQQLIKPENEQNIGLNNSTCVVCFKIKKEKEENFQYNDMNVSFEKFPWKTYYKLNPELITNNSSKEIAWHHWQNYGKKEERAFSYVNNTNDHRARFGNLFFLNMCLHLFSQKYDLKSSYKYEKQFNQLGIYFHKGTKIYNKNYLLTDYNFENVLESDASPKNIIIDNNVWFHTNRFCKIMEEFLKKNNLFSQIRNHNRFKERYNRNNDLFMHIRLGDVSEKTLKNANYYINTLKQIKFDKGYIASDSIHDKLCQYLIQKYNLTIIDKSEVETIMFGCTCKNIILSGGTFSWLIGFLALVDSNVYYPEVDLKNRWYGDIFSFSNWINIKV